MIGCKRCDFTCGDFVRNSRGGQRSGYRLLEAHYQREHGTLPRHRGPFWQPNPIYPARIDDRCAGCEGAGCEGCEPAGRPERWNFNTLERLPDVEPSV